MHEYDRFIQFTADITSEIEATRSWMLCIYTRAFNTSVWEAVQSFLGPCTIPSSDNLKSQWEEFLRVTANMEATALKQALECLLHANA